ncbi:MAG TPA: LytR C-terminal domain-containing protein, partial [Actinomycetota bacterium]|nr:LytR C-terminal domain-containing protein [Actinomycetota bacterium]
AVEAVSGARGDSTPAGAVATATPEPTDKPEPTPEPETAKPEEPSETPKPESTPKPTPEPKEETEPLITEGITVQVLNATDVADADDRMADKLSKLGFTVVAVESASSRYEATTVFWSTEEAKEAAQRLADRFGWTAQVKPENLSTTVSLHVVVGAVEG